MMEEEIQDRYFTEALHLFYETRWLFNTPVTELLVNGSLDSFPEQWLDALRVLNNQELNNLVVNNTVKSQWPGTLKAFIKKCRYINRLPVINSLSPIQLPRNFTAGLSIKKQHEIIHLAHLVHAQCATDGIKMIVDLGAGLGYICQLLYFLYGYHILGLERSQANVHKARSRQEKMYPDSLTKVKYACCELTCDSVEAIESILKHEFQGQKDICLIGLHACGDLSVHASKIFFKMKAARLFIMISCCYHKLSISRSVQCSTIKKQYFHNFPMSHSLQDAIRASDFDVGQFLRQPFLRLACQEPAERWYNMSENVHDEHSFHVLARAVLELYANQHGFLLQKRVQKGTRKSQCTNFETYVDDSLLRYKFKSIKEETELKGMQDHNELKNGIMKLWEQHCDKLKAAEIYTALQLILQGPAESLVLQDRLCWLKEQGLEATIISVMDKCLSPRSHAIVSRKR